MSFFRLFSPKWPLVFLIQGLIQAVCFIGCTEPQADTEIDLVNCDNLCGPGTACLNGVCARVRPANELESSDMLQDMEQQDQMLMDQDSSDLEVNDMDLDMGSIEYTDADIIDAGTIDFELDQALSDASLDQDPPCEAQEEICDGQDNDCDGLIDEADTRIGEFCPSGQLGACAEGTYRCDQGQLSCLANQSPSVEQCDTVDNDCDGRTDEETRHPEQDQGCVSDLPGECSQGQWACESGQWQCAPLRQAVAELCDALDNDCDGAIDEAVQAVGMQCETGLIGICAEGVYFCDQGRLSCSQTFMPLAEICDGQDNDCDGSVDEVFPQENTVCATEGLGVCAEGIADCIEGELLCVQATEQSAEQCNQADDDCDGLVDEDFEQLGSICTVGIGQCERNGLLSCDAEGQYICVGESGEPSEERCNGLDDDCDGEVDNLIEPPQVPKHCGACGQACEVTRAFPVCIDSNCQIGACHNGWVDLDGELDNGCEYACTFSHDGVEICDGLDNDCDGEIDGPTVCVGDAFQWCRTRQDLGLNDVLCEDFSATSLSQNFWTPSRLGGGNDATPLSTARLYKVNQASLELAGHNRRIRRISPQFKMGLSLSFAHPLVIAIGQKKITSLDSVPPTEYDQVIVPNHVLNEDDGLVNAQGLVISPEEGWLGYGLWLWNDEASQSPKAEIRSMAMQSVLWRGTLPELADGTRHWLTWQHQQDGTFLVMIDGLEKQPTLTVSSAGLSALNPNELIPDELNEISLRLAPLNANQTSSEIDSLVVQHDQDHDDIHEPFDNCPQVFNPEQVDLDGNGVGLACDDFDQDQIENSLDHCPLFPSQLVGEANALIEQEQQLENESWQSLCDLDYDLLINLKQGYNAGAWLLSLKSGLLDRQATTSLNSSNFAVGLTHSLTWQEYNSIYTLSPLGTNTLSAPRKLTSDWLGDRLVYHNDSYTAVYLQRSGYELTDTLVAEAESDGRLKALVASDETRLLVLSTNTLGTQVQSFDVNGEPLGASISLPEQSFGDAMPYVDWHTEAGLLLVSGQTGEAQGVSFIDPTTGVLTPVLARPTVRARYLPNGQGFVAIHIESDQSHSLVLYPHLNDQDAFILYDHSKSLQGDALDWTQSSPDEQPNQDGDQIPDRWDHCPEITKDQSFTSTLIENSDPFFKDLSLDWQGEELFASWSTNINYRNYGRLLRLSPSGDIIQYVNQLNRCGHCFAKPQVLWSQGQHLIPHINGVSDASSDENLQIMALNLAGEFHNLKLIEGPFQRFVYKSLDAIMTNFGLRLSLHRLTQGVYRNLDFLLTPLSETYNTIGFELDSQNFPTLHQVPTPDGLSAQIQLVFRGSLNVTSSLGTITSPVAPAKWPISAISDNDQVWVAYTQQTETQLELRRFDLSEQTVQRPIVVIDQAEMPSYPKLLQINRKLGVFWLQTLNNQRVLLSRWLNMDTEEWLTEPVIISSTQESIGDPSSPNNTSFGLAWDGQKVHLLYPRNEGGLYYLSGAIQCW